MAKDQATPSEKKNKKAETGILVWLKYPFTEDELKDIAMDMANATNKGSEVEAKKKAVNAGFKDELESHSLTARTSARLIEQGYEMRDIACHKVVDFKEDFVTITRKDTGEIVEERKIKDSERQMTLD